MNTREIALEYWRSWHNHSNWKYTRSLMHDNLKFDAGHFKTDNADELITVMKMGNPWKNIELLDIQVCDNKACLIYEGIDTKSEHRIRIAETLWIEEGKVAKCLATIAQLSPPE